MEIWLVVFGSCLALGAFVGFMAGLLGIGGGIIAVPILLQILPIAGVNTTNLPHVAIATSLAAIILTSLSSARAHNKRQNIPWPLLKPIAPGLVLGSLCAGFISEQIPAAQLQQVFAGFVVLMAIQMAMPIKAQASRSLPSKISLFISAGFIAVTASLMGIGGGVLIIPFLTWFGLEMRYAVGFSSAAGVIIAIFGSLSYTLAGLNATGLPAGTLGYIYLPALLGIVSSSMIIAPLGAKAASHLPTAKLKKIFAILLVIVGVKLAIG